MTFRLPTKNWSAFNNLNEFSYIDCVSRLSQRRTYAIIGDYPVTQFEAINYKPLLADRMEVMFMKTSVHKGVLYTRTHVYNQLTGELLE